MTYDVAARRPSSDTRDSNHNEWSQAQCLMTSLTALGKTRVAAPRPADLRAVGSVVDEAVVTIDAAVRTGARPGARTGRTGVGLHATTGARPVGAHAVVTAGRTGSPSGVRAAGPSVRASGVARC